MRVSIKIGYKTYIGELSGAEVEVLARVAGKLAKVDERYVDSKAESSPGTPHPSAGQYAFIIDDSKQSEERPEFELKVVDPGIQLLKQSTLEAMLARIEKE